MSTSATTSGSPAKSSRPSVASSQRACLGVRHHEQVPATASRKARRAVRPGNPRAPEVRRPHRAARGARNAPFAIDGGAEFTGNSLNKRTFVEVETPMLQVMHGGANARPFVTHINAYDMPVYLRIAPELYLKRLLVGGVEKVFEINRNFRNEGVDSTHNPEFTMLEMYEAYGDYSSMRILTQQLIQEAAIAVFGEPMARRLETDGEVREYDLSGDWPVKTMIGSLSEALGEEVSLDTPLEKLQQFATKFEVEVPPQADAGVLLEELYVVLVEAKTTTPVFYQDFPKNNAPLTRMHRDDDRLTEKWDLVCWVPNKALGTPS